MCEASPTRTVTAEVALALGRAAVRVLDVTTVVVGRDTRRSGPMLEAAVLAGVTARGRGAVALGVVPTPAVAHRCGPPSGASTVDSTAGVMISASHNPFADNGLKIFAPGGRKLTDAQQHEIEARSLEALLDGSPAARADRRHGRRTVVGTTGRPTAYCDYVVDAVEGRDLDGLTVVLDCANGAELRPSVQRCWSVSVRRVEVIGANPDGVNINDGCGSNHPAGLAAAVVGRGADVGIAFDGDADRVAGGRSPGPRRRRRPSHRHVCHRPALLAVCCADDTVVVTVMSNLGFRRAMAEAGHHGRRDPGGRPLRARGPRGR